MGDRGRGEVLTCHISGHRRTGSREARSASSLSRKLRSLGFQRRRRRPRVPGARRKAPRRRQRLDLRTRGGVAAAAAGCRRVRRGVAVVAGLAGDGAAAAGVVGGGAYGVAGAAVAVGRRPA